MNATARTALATLCLLAAAGVVEGHGEKKDGHDEGGGVAEIDREQRDWGVAAAPEEATRRIEVSMSDRMRFEPGSIAVEEGETVTFVVRNDGELMHEFVLGTQQALDEHAALMRKYPNMEHDEPYMAHVPPGESGEITWTFNRDGEIVFACLVAGHYEAGMSGRVDVADAS